MRGMITPQQIESLISSFAAKVERLKHDLEIAEAELRGMTTLRDRLSQPDPITKMVVAQRMRIRVPPKLGGSDLHSIPSSSEVIEGGYRGGRQPGAISKTWRGILSGLYWDTSPLDEAFDDAHIVKFAKRYGITLRPSEAATRMEHYSKFGYVTINDGAYRVTSIAAEKFGFDKGPLKNEAPASAEAPNNPARDESGT
jgi:hypothetical protein